MNERLPALVRGTRRGMLARLVGNGLAQAWLAVSTVALMPLALEATSVAQLGTSLGGLTVAALALGVLRWRERVQAEELGQHYVQQLRRGLVASSLAGDRSSLGVTVARTTNDLTSVRNWISLGIAPLAVAVPLIAGSLIALWLLHPALSAAVGVPLLALGGAVAVLSRGLFARARELRRQRGRLASHLADTVAAAAAIRASGGTRRELRNVDDRSVSVRDAAVARAHSSGALRGAAAVAAGLAVVLVTGVGSVASLPIGTVAAALTMVGILATPIADLARVVEYRQSFRAAAAILGPGLVAGRTARTRDRALVRDARNRTTAPDSNPDPDPDQAPDQAPGGAPGGPRRDLAVRGLQVDGVDVPNLSAEPGDRVLVTSGDPQRVQAVLDALAGLRPHRGDVTVAGQVLGATPGEVRRGLVGAAGRGWALERGTIERAVRYRDPAGDVPVDDTLRLTGLDATVARLPDGVRTRLRRGGEPLSLPERAQVLLARAVHGAPALVVLDHLEAQLDPDGRRVLAAVIAAHPGVVVAACDDPSVLGHAPRTWDLDVPAHPPGCLVDARTAGPH